MMDLIEMLDFEPAALSREKVLRLQAEIEKLPQIVPPLKHLVHGGMYAREMFMPAGTIVVGRIHLHDHLCQVLGDVSVYTVGLGVARITGCHLLPSSAGAKRVLVAHADTWWTTIHANPGGLTDVDELERRNVTDSFDVADACLAKAALGLKEH